MTSSGAPVTLARAHVVAADRLLEPGWITVADGTIVDLGENVPPSPAETVPGWLVPGFVDIHMHGGGGHDVTSSAKDIAAAVAFHRTCGTTATMISLVTAPIPTLLRQLGWIADLADDPYSGVIGAHLEGPFLSNERCGAQHPDHLIVPSQDALTALLHAARGHLRCMTIAPELPGALEIIDQLRANGVVAAIGHTNANYEEAVTAFNRGATLATHLYNGMRPVHHREPGPVMAALDVGATCEIINDGVHVHPAIVRQVQARGTHRMALITDAISATGVGDGHYELGGQAVQVEQGQARLATTGALAGSTLTLDAAIRRAVRAGLSIRDAVDAATITPARAVHVADRHGILAPGRRADIVLLDENLSVESVMTASPEPGSSSL